MVVEFEREGKLIGGAIAGCGTLCAPATFSLEQVLQLFAIACEKPEWFARTSNQSLDGTRTGRRTGQTVRRAYFTRHVGRLLKEASLKPHQSGYWLNPRPSSLTIKSKTSATPT